MKKLYRKRGTVHPSPPIISNHLSFLPAAILTLAAALSPDDREVLAYLISSAVNNFADHRGGNAAHQIPSAAKGGSDHPPVSSCGCFRCYTSYWVRWDSSPNRQLIHAIIDAYEEKLAQTESGKSNKKERKKRSTGSGFGSGSGKVLGPSNEEEATQTEMETEAAGNGGGGAKGAEKGSVRWIVSYIGERIWGSGWDY